MKQTSVDAMSGFKQFRGSYKFMARCTIKFNFLLQEDKKNRSNNFTHAVKIAMTSTSTRTENNFWQQRTLFTWVFLPLEVNSGIFTNHLFFRHFPSVGSGPHGTVVDRPLCGAATFQKTGSSTARTALHWLCTIKNKKRSAVQL